MVDSKEIALVQFGDGQEALLYKEGPIETHDDGLEYQPLLLYPSKNIREIYKLQSEDMTIMLPDGLKGIWWTYRAEYVHWILREPRAAKVWVVCNFNGSESPFMQSYNKKLLRKIEEVMLERSSYKLAYLTKMDELRRALSQQTELNNMIRKMSDAITNKSEKSMEEDKKSDIPNIIGGV